MAGWWFGTWMLFFHNIRDVILSIDFHIFQDDWNHQPDGDKCDIQWYTMLCNDKQWYTIPSQYLTEALNTTGLSESMAIEGHLSNSVCGESLTWLFNTPRKVSYPVSPTPISREVLEIPIPKSSKFFTFWEKNLCSHWIWGYPIFRHNPGPCQYGAHLPGIVCTIEEISEECVPFLRANCDVVKKHEKAIARWGLQKFEEPTMIYVSFGRYDSLMSYPPANVSKKRTGTWPIESSLICLT